MNIKTDVEAIQTWEYFQQKYAFQEARAEFNHLLNGVKIPTDADPGKQIIVKNALAIGNWENPIFKDPEILAIALSLYDPDNVHRISQQQVYSILERNQNLLTNTLTGNYRILRPDGSFTEEALEILLPSIENSRLMSFQTEEQKESFRLLVASLPPSEQTFYTTTLGNVGKPDTQGRILQELGGILVRNDNVVHLAAGARDAHGIARYGAENYVKPVTVLAKLGLRHIEEGARTETRPATVFVPNAPYYEKIHKHTDFTPMEAWYHDYYHALLMSLIPKNIRYALLRIVDVLRKSLNVEWSKSIWTSIDAELVYLLTSDDITSARTAIKDLLADENSDVLEEPYSYLIPFLKGGSLNELSTRDNTDLFCRILSYGRAHIDPAAHGNYLFLANTKITVSGMAVLIDMVKDPQIWESMNINPDDFITKSSDPNCDLPYKKYYLQIKKIYPFIANDEPKIQLLKCQMYFAFVETGYEERFFSTCAYLDSIKASLAGRLTIQKISMKDLKEQPHLRQSIYAGKELLSNNEIANMEFLFLDGQLLTEEALSKLMKECYVESLKMTLQRQPNLSSSPYPSHKAIAATTNSDSTMYVFKSFSEKTLPPTVGVNPLPALPLNNFKQINTFNSASNESMELDSSDTQKNRGKGLNLTSLYASPVYSSGLAPVTNSNSNSNSPSSSSSQTGNTSASTPNQTQNTTDLKKRKLGSNQ